MSKQRKCNKWGCKGLMRPTRETHHLNNGNRIYQCVVCGNKTPWLDNPLKGSTAAMSLHAIGFCQFSGLSMSSDPDVYPPKPPVRPTRPRRS